MSDTTAPWTEFAKSRVGDFRRLQQAGLLCLDGDFVPSVHYPPITMYPQIAEEELFASYRNPADGLFDVYVHIPFCERLCVFCHYPVMLNSPAHEKDRYLDAMEQEMDLYVRRLGVQKLKTRSILVGGGTPTYLTPAQLERFLRFFTSRLDLSALTQFNYDLDPGSIIGPEGQEKLRLLKSYGVDRLTLGIQSFDEGILRKMNRPHDSEEAVEAIRNSMAAGLVTNIEIIFGYPGETMETWLDSVEKAISVDPDEIQLYRLKVQPYGDRTGTIVAIRERGLREFPGIENVLMMKEAAIRLLSRHGYHQNLRRVFSKKREIFSHYADNQCCGLLDEVGFGQTAFSSLRDRFGLNTDSIPDYYARIGAGKLPLNRGVVRTKDEQLRWCIVLPLKNRKVWKDYFLKLTGVSLNSVFTKKVERLKDFGLLQEDDRSIELTELGSFFADEVCQQFYREEHLPFPRHAYAEGPLNPYLDCEL
ncbi:MAG: coproporphyrinogen III oxidase family protein [Candidatus Riflebacteria bacterium]|nr:coproporphyrinogen III oxidase family protein [Candidatus Riflebacteria bacterium]